MKKKWKLFLARHKTTIVWLWILFLAESEERKQISLKFCCLKMDSIKTTRASFVALRLLQCKNKMCFSKQLDDNKQMTRNLMLSAPNNNQNFQLDIFKKICLSQSHNSLRGKNTVYFFHYVIKMTPIVQTQLDSVQLFDDRNKKHLPKLEKNKNNWLKSLK